MAGLVDMAQTPEERKDDMVLASPSQNQYPYGLRINLGHDELEKLGVDHSDWEIGDVFPLDILAKVVSKSANETEGNGENCSISLQITHIGAEEHEDEIEDESDDEPDLRKHGYLRYK